MTASSAGPRRRCEDWLVDLIDFGSGWNDAVLFAEAHRRRVPSDGDLADLAELAEALAGSQERHREIDAAGRGLRARPRAAWPHPARRSLAGRLPLLRRGRRASSARMASPLETALAAWLQAFASNLVQAAIRLGVTGQQGAMATIAALEPVILETGRPRGTARRSTISARPRCCPTSSRCNTKRSYSRLFRS